MLKKTFLIVAIASWWPSGACPGDGGRRGGALGVKWGVIGAAFLLGIAAAAGAAAQGRATSAACEGMSRNPGAAAPIRLMTIIGLALIESLVLYALLIAFLSTTNRSEAPGGWPSGSRCPLSRTTCPFETFSRPGRNTAMGTLPTIRGLNS